ncbi:unnamed protein product [Rotaria sp. Silwood2]|nr:unnamed protein product [Rotaria sp. Silwood2]
MDFIEKSANRECPGGLYGCAVNADSDMRCRAGAKYFLDKNTLTDQGIIIRQISSIIVLFLFFCFLMRLN